MTVVISPHNCLVPEKKDADIVLDGETDFAKLAAEAGKPNRCIKILAGTLNGNGGFNPDGSRYLRPAPGVTILGAGPGQTIIEAASDGAILDEDAQSIAAVIPEVLLPVGCGYSPVLGPVISLGFP